VHILVSFKLNHWYFAAVLSLVSSSCSQNPVKMVKSSGKSHLLTLSGCSTNDVTLFFASTNIVVFLSDMWAYFWCLAFSINFAFNVNITYRKCYVCFNNGTYCCLFLLLVKIDEILIVQLTNMYCLPNELFAVRVKYGQ